MAGATGASGAPLAGGAATGLEQRPVVSELVLVVIVVLFVGACASVLNAAHRGLPQAATLAAAMTPVAAVTPTPTPARRSPLAVVPTPGAAAPTAKPPAAPAPAVPTATATPGRGNYAAVTGAQLNGAPDQYQGKKVMLSGSVYYVAPRGENTWVQVLTQDNVFVDINFAGQSDVRKGQQVNVYGTADGKTTIKATDGNTYVQPFINPGEYIDQA